MTRPYPQGYGPDCKEPLTGSDADIDRGKRVCRLYKTALEKVEELIGNSNQSQSNSIGASSVLGLFASGKMGDNEELSYRTALFYGLSPAEQQKYVRENPESFVKKNGSNWELHNGYWFGGSRMKRNAGGMDCSDFVAHLFKSAGSRLEAFSTSDLRELAEGLGSKRGSANHFDNPDVKKLSACFTAVKLDQGEALLPGDILISYNTWNGGHVVVVDAFNPKTGMVRTVEAGGGKLNTVGFSERPLFEPDCARPLPQSESNVISHLDSKAVRADLVGLRFKAVQEKNCPLRLE
jgi:hypothetical protein